MHVLYRITKGIHQFVANRVRYIPTKYHCKVSPSLDSFKRHLKTHYFTSP